MRGNRAVAGAAILALGFGLSAAASAVGSKPHGPILTFDEKFVRQYREKAVQMGMAPYSHAPVRAGNCGACHASLDKPKTLKAVGGKLCAGCHPESLKYGKRPVVHAAYGDGDCSTCHDPHGSGHPGLLPDEVNAFCLTCHQADAEAVVKSHRGIVVERAECTECHDGHSSEKKKLVSDRPAHPPFEGECTACHAAPIGGKVRLVGKAKDICGPCHPDIFEGKAAHAHPPFAAGECWRCHSPHVSNGRKMLKGRLSRICRACHTTIPDRGHPVVNHRIEIVNAKGEVVLDCAGCHTPHGGENLKLLQKPRGEICRKCHPN